MVREEATSRGFGPETTKTVQIVVDGANGLKDNLEPLFPNAIITLDVCHVVEKLWEVGHRFYKEGSEELKAWVEELKGLVYEGTAPRRWCDGYRSFSSKYQCVAREPRDGGRR